MSVIYYVIRSYLETDAMTKAKYVAENYMKEYIHKNKIATTEEVEELANIYDEINKIGIPAYNFILIANCILKIIIYTIIVIIMNFIK